MIAGLKLLVTTRYYNFFVSPGFISCSAVLLDFIFFKSVFQGSLVPKKSTFPSGIKALADYVHSKGLKLGIYSDAGYITIGFAMFLTLFPGDVNKYTHWLYNCFGL